MNLRVILDVHLDINRNRSKECTSSKLKENEEILITVRNEIASKSNEYFAVNVEPNLAAKIPVNQQTYNKSCLKRRNINLVFLEPVTKIEIGKQITKLHANKSSSYDDIDPKKVKKHSHFH